MQSSFSCPFLGFFFSPLHILHFSSHTQPHCRQTILKKKLKEVWKKTTVIQGVINFQKCKLAEETTSSFCCCYFYTGIFLQSCFKDRQGRNSLFPRPPLLPLLYSDISRQPCSSHISGQSKCLCTDWGGGGWVGRDDESIRHLIKIWFRKFPLTKQLSPVPPPWQIEPGFLQGNPPSPCLKCHGWCGICHWEWETPSQPNKSHFQRDFCAVPASLLAPWPRCSPVHHRALQPQFSLRFLL